LYRAFADITVENSGTIQETAGKIEKELNAL
jgi:dephospho-CoA kinase